MNPDEPHEETPPPGRPYCRCSNSVDLYRKFFGPTIDESFLILLILLIALYHILNRTNENAAENTNEEENNDDDDNEEFIQREVQTCNFNTRQPRRRRPYSYCFFRQ